MGGLFEKGTLLIHQRALESVLYTQLQSGKAGEYKKLEVMQLRSKTNPNFQLVNKPSRICPYEVLQT